MSSTWKKLKGGNFIQTITPDTTSYYGTFRTGTFSQDDSGGAGTGSQVGEFDTSTFAPNETVVNSYAKYISPTFTAASGKSIGNCYSQALGLTINGAGTCFNNVTQKIFGPAASGAGTKTFGYGLQVYKGTGCVYNYAAYFDDIQLGGDLTTNQATQNVFTTATTINIGSIVSLSTSQLSVTGNISSTSSIISSSRTAGIGYSSGASITQLTNKSTSISSNNLSGVITMNNAALAANTNVSFTFTNTAIAAGDQILLSHVGGGTLGNYFPQGTCGAGSATVAVRNLTGGSLSDAVQLKFTVIKGANS